MNRRKLLKGLSIALATASAAVVAVPGINHILSFVRRRSPSKAVTSRVARLSELPVGKPVQVPLIGNHRDAWTVYPAETIGRIWLVRQSDDAASPEATKVAAFTATCPHLGCTIQFDSGNENFVCPCHKAAFDLNGAKTASASEQHNHSPRGMDSLECRIVSDENAEPWVEVTYQKFEPGLTKKVARA